MKINRTAYRTIEILELLSMNPRGLTLKEIISSLEIPRTSVFDILQSLIAKRMVVELNGDSKKYSIGLRAFEIGMSYLQNTNIIDVIKPILEEIAETTNRTAFFGVMDNNMVTYVYKYEPTNVIVTTSHIGTKNGLHCTSLGKAILSGLDEEALLSVAKEIEYTKNTEHTITCRKELLKEIDAVRERGYAIDKREIEEHILCFAAPVFDYDGNTIGAISLSGIYSEDIDFEKVGNKVKEAANKISKRLGYTK